MKFKPSIGHKGKKHVATYVDSLMFQHLEEQAKVHNITIAELVRQMISYCLNESKEGIE